MFAFILFEFREFFCRDEGGCSTGKACIVHFTTFSGYFFVSDHTVVMLRRYWLGEYDELSTDVELSLCVLSVPAVFNTQTRMLWRTPSFLHRFSPLGTIIVFQTLVNKCIPYPSTQRGLVT